MIGRLLYTGWATNRAKKASPFSMMRNRISNPPNNPAMWTDWFLGGVDQTAGVGKLKFWDGNYWTLINNIKVRWY